MKPLELNVYPPMPTAESLAPLTREEAFRELKRASDLNDLIVDKRLTNAECAAEYWRAVGDESMITEGYNWTEMCGEWPVSEEEAIRRSRILTRFATLPSYDEQDQP